MAASADWVWIDPAVILAVHEEQLAEHGGGAGVRDAGRQESALERPRHLARYGEPDACEIAAAYGVGLARNNAFIDGNQRTAFVAAELFLTLNGLQLAADNADCVITMLKLAAGDLDETTYAAWLRERIAPR